MSASPTDTLSKFKEKITINKSWKYYKIKAVVARESDDEKWKIILLITLPDRTGDIGSKILLGNSAVKFIEETRNIDTLNIFLEDLVERRSIVIADASSSAELIGNVL